MLTIEELETACDSSEIIELPKNSMEGPDLSSVEVFWDRVVDWLGLYDLVEITREEGEGSGRQLGMSVGVPKVASFDANKKEDASVTKGVRKSRKQAITTVARDSLEAVGTPIVIDDFHYVADDATQAMAMLKRFGSVTVLNGHIHQIIQKVEGNVSFHTADSTAFPQPAPGTAPSPGPMKVPADQLHAALGIRTLNVVPGKQPLALIDTPLA